MTYEQRQILEGLLVWIPILVIYLLRNTKLGFLWKGLRMFFIVLLLTLGANYAKKSVKEWWEKD
jgi:hypothetical protein